MAEASVPVECLVEETDADFTVQGDVATTLLSTAAVHPLHRGAVESLLSGSASDWSIVDRLVARGELIEVMYRGRVFYRTARGRRARRAAVAARLAAQEKGSGRGPDP